MLPIKARGECRGVNVAGKAQREALTALLLMLLPNLVLTGVGLLMRGPAQQVTEAQAAGHFGLARFLRQVGLCIFLLLPTLLFTAIHLPARLLGGESSAQALMYAAVQLLPMALLFGGAMLAANHAAALTLLHLAWNWASVIRR